MTSRTWFIQLIGIFLLLLLLVYSIPILTQKLNTEMTNYIQKTLHEKGHSWVQVEVQGRDVIVKGETSDSILHQKIVNQIRGFWFVKNVTDHISPIIIEPYSLNLHWDGSELSIKGYIDSDSTQSIINQTIQQHFKTKKIKQELQVAVGAPKSWQNLIQVLLQQISNLQLASVQIIGHTIDIHGKALTHIERTVLEDAIIPFRKQKYQFTTHIIALDQPAVFCQEKFNTLLKESNIKFKVGKSIITSSSDDLLSRLANIAVFCATSVIRIIGYTDNAGDEMANEKLSLQRAKSVKAWLFTQGAIPLERLKTEGKGSGEPIASNDTQQGRAKNRRIEFILEGF